MFSEVLRIINPGIYSSAQDIGRRGYRKFGMPLSGPMDPYAHKAANLLVGNPMEAPCIEITGSVFSALFIENSKFVIAGGMIDAGLGSENIESGKIYKASAGDTLVLKSLKSGLRVYLAVEGGFICDELLGSMSMTKGSTLTEGTILKRGEPVSNPNETSHNFSYISRSGIYNFKVRLGPDTALFSKKQIKEFFNQPLKVSKYYNRMGIRFNKVTGKWKSDVNFVTKPVFPGCIQITPDGTPILIMNDGQTTGGYPVIAVVDKNDMKKAGQLKFNDRVILGKLNKISDIINR